MRAKSIRILIRKTISTLLTGLIVWQIGCMSIATLSSNMKRDDATEPLVYGGARSDLELIGYSGDATGMGLGACVPVFGIIDLPFSLVADTILLPVTITMALTPDENRPSSDDAYDQSIQKEPPVVDQDS